ncbi:MAG: protein kinase [Deltaproteobacteria bacterium]|nr:protein kinase [Deltaproteobacteria bacterium]
MAIYGVYSVPTQGETADLVLERTSSVELVACPGPRRAAWELPEVGDRVGSRYLLTELLGDGGQGIVFAAFDEGLHREVAVKLPRGGRPVDEERRQARLLREARITAGLRPSRALVLLLDAGEDLRFGPYLVLPHIAHASTLAEAVADAHAAGRPLTALLRAFADLADAVAGLHEQGLVHADLHAKNVLLRTSVDDRYEVFLIDLGVAQPISATPAMGVGAPSALAPEVVRGTALCAPSIDIYGLGTLLSQVLSGEQYLGGLRLDSCLGLLRAAPPPAGLPADCPAALVELVRACMAVEAEDRPPTARLVAERVRAHLRAQAAEAEALALLAAATEIEARAAALQLEHDQRRGAQRTARGKVPPTDVEALRPLLLEDDRLHELVDEINGLRLEAEGLERAAQLRAPDAPAVRAACFDRLAARHAACEAAGAPRQAARYAEQLRGVDAGRAVVHLARPGFFALPVDSPASVRVRAYAQREGRLQLGPVLWEGTGDGLERPLPPGSYCAELEAEHGLRFSYPFVVERGVLVRPTDARGAPTAICVPRAGEVHDDEIYVPAGITMDGGDPEAIGSARRDVAALWCDNFVIARQLVTFAQIAAWLGEARDLGMYTDALLPAPRGSAPERSALKPSERGPFEIGADHDGDQYDPEWPALLIDRVTALILLAAHGACSGRSMRLPRATEWLRAARGADLRCYPWGNTFDPSFSMNRTGGKLPGAAGRHPVDTSPFGMADTCGCVAVLVDADENFPDQDLTMTRGGGWVLGASAARLTSRLSLAGPQSRSVGVGLRWARSLGPSR